MAVTAEQVYNETAYLIPSQNILTEAQLLGIAQTLIDKYGDDDSNLGLIKCEFLKQVGIQNGVIGSLSSGSMKREKLGDHEIEYFQGSTVDWQSYIKAVKEDLCPMFGIVSSVSFGAKINSSDKKKVINPCCGGHDDFYL